MAEQHTPNARAVDLSVATRVLVYLRRQPWEDVNELIDDFCRSQQIYVEPATAAKPAGRVAGFDLDKLPADLKAKAIAALGGNGRDVDPDPPEDDEPPPPDPDS